jgi:hypothetical protein
VPCVVVAKFVVVVESVGAGVTGLGGLGATLGGLGATLGGLGATLGGRLGGGNGAGVGTTVPR